MLRQGQVFEQRQVPAAVLAPLFALLPLSTSDLCDAVDALLDSNPMVERAAGHPCPGCGRHLRRRRCPVCVSATVVREMADAVSWRDGLLSDASVVFADREALAVVVASLDGRGLLADDIGELAAQFHLAPGRLQGAIDALKEVGPPGVAAAGPLECVRDQCRSLLARGLCSPLLVAIAEHHLDLLAAGDLTAIAGAESAPMEQVVRCVEQLRTDVHPFPAVTSPAVQAAAPDLWFRRDRSGGIDVAVADRAWFGLQTATLPDDAIARAWAAPHARAVGMFFRQLDARASLLRRVGLVIAREQHGFLVEGPGAHRPLLRQQVAEQLRVHPSTVGRAVTGKHAALPDGKIVPLEACFGGATGPKAALARLLVEHPAASDAQLVRLLADVGVTLARRTVAKYRSELGVTARNAKPVSLPQR